MKANEKEERRLWRMTNKSDEERGTKDQKNGVEVNVVRDSCVRSERRNGRKNI
jgi:hypothetical protein